MPGRGGSHVHVREVLQPRPSVHVFPSKTQNRYEYGSEPPVAVAVHVIAVPAREGNATFALSDVTESGAAAPRWVTVTSCPAIDAMPLRELDAGLAVTDTVMLPLPVREPTPPIAIQVASLVAVQGQPAGAVTAIDEFPANGSSEIAVLES